MKIRTDFITNSSSSSFVLVAKPISAEELDKVVSPIALYEEHWDGQCIFDVTKEMIPILVSHASQFAFYDRIREAESTIVIRDPEIIEQGTVIMGGNATINNPQNVEELIEMLGDSYENPTNDESI